MDDARSRVDEGTVTTGVVAPESYGETDPQAPDVIPAPSAVPPRGAVEGEASCG